MPNRLSLPEESNTLGAVNMLRALGLCWIAAAGLAGCYREVSDATAGPGQLRERVAGPWTIDGVRPGQDFADVQRRLGDPQEIRGTGGVRTARWERRPTVVTVGSDGRVTEVLGETVQARGRVLVRGGATEAEVTAVLGPGTVRKTHQPGSGVIGVGRVHTGTALFYDEGGVRFELPVFGEAAGRFLARPVPAR